MKEKNRVRNLDIEEKILQASDINHIADPEDEHRPFSEDFFLGHKVISSRDCSNVKVFYLSLLRDLFYRLHDGVFLSISDITNMHHERIDRSEWTLEDYKNYVDYYGICLPFEGLKEECPPEGAYVFEPESLVNYGLKNRHLRQPELVENLRKINEFTYPIIKKNLRNPEFNQRNVGRLLVKSGVHEINDVYDALSKDANGVSLTKRYSMRVFK